MDVDLFDYSPIVDRDPVEWPGGARVAFYGWRDYGARVGIWRLMETLDRHGKARRARSSASVTHGKTNSVLHADMSVDEERASPTEIVEDQLDQLYADSATSGRVMALALHPFVIGQPFRSKYLDRALEYVAGHEGVWLTTTDDIAEHYARTRA